ncbi:MAG: FliI/YscN family ATPase [Phycisphaera sp.]|nr:FliI/YscN family ATPase [Phycisphaera sp.]
MIRDAAAMELSGGVEEIRGLTLRVSDLPVPVGATVRIIRGGEERQAMVGEVVGFDRGQTIVMPLGASAGVRQGDRVVAEEYMQTVRVGTSLLGRVLDGLGRPIDGKGPLRDTLVRSLHPKPIEALNRPLISQPLATGVRAIDALASVGRGQRIGIFAAPGLGKSTLLGMMARQTSADVSVIALVGERGREVRDFVDHHLGEQGLPRSVVVCATSDEPALVRIRAAFVAATIAESFRDEGKDVLLIMDSVTRFCQAQRQVGLAAGEPPATRGYPPSVFAMLPVLLERSGRTEKGSITGLYSVLVEGDDMNEPISDASRGVLDGHIVLSQRLAHRGHWPAIDITASISRVADAVTDVEHQSARQDVLRSITAYRDIEDLLNIGAYAPGANVDADVAIECKPAIDQLLQQGRNEKGVSDFARTRAQLLALGQHIRGRKMVRTKGRTPQAPLPTGNRQAQSAPTRRAPA